MARPKTNNVRFVTALDPKIIHDFDTICFKLGHKARNTILQEIISKYIYENRYLLQEQSYTQPYQPVQVEPVEVVPIIKKTEKLEVETKPPIISVKKEKNSVNAGFNANNFKL